MATYATSIEFVFNAKNDDKAQEMAERISHYVLQEKMAKEASIIDTELLDDDEAVEELDFNEEDE